MAITSALAAETASPPGVPAPPSVRTRWQFSIANFGNGMFNAFFNSALPLFLAQYQLPNVVVGLLAQERSLIGAVLEPVIGSVSDRTRSRFGRRRPFFLVGAPLTAAMLLLLATAPPTPVMVVLLMLMPLALALANVPYRAMLADIAPPQLRGGIGGLLTTMEMLGLIFVSLLAAFFWQDHQVLVFVLIALVLVLGYLYTFWRVREPALSSEPLEARPRFSLRAYLLELRAFAPALRFALALTLFWFGTGGLSPFLTRYAVYELYLSEQLAMLVFMMLGLATAACALPMGYLGDRLGKRKVLVASLLIFAAACALGGMAQSLPQIMVALLVVGVANGGLTALAVPYLSQLLPSRRMGELLGVAGMLWSLAQPLGSVFAGLMADLTGTYRVLFFLTAAYLMVAALVTHGVNEAAAAQRTGVS